MIAKNLRCSRATPTESTYCSFAGDFSAHRAVKTVGAPILLRDAKRTWRRRRFYCATRRELGGGAKSTARREEKLAMPTIFSSIATTSPKNSSYGFYSRAIYTLWGQSKGPNERRTHDEDKSITERRRCAPGFCGVGCDGVIRKVRATRCHQ